MNRLVSNVAELRHVMMLLVLAAIVNESSTAQSPFPHFSSLINTRPDSVGGQRIESLDLSAAGLRSKLRVGDVIMDGMVMESRRAISTLQPDGLVIISAALARGQRVVLTLLRPLDANNNPPRNYQQIRIELLPVDLQRHWSHAANQGRQNGATFGFNNTVPRSTGWGAGVAPAQKYGSPQPYNAPQIFGNSNTYRWPKYDLADGGVAVNGGNAAGEVAAAEAGGGDGESAPMEESAESYEPREAEIPRFPWPPPRASAIQRISRELIEPTDRVILLADVDARLRRALDATGYFDSSYYAVPRGFALVTRIEQIEYDGSPKRGVARWSVRRQPLKQFSLKAYVNALFGAAPGKYRVIVFLVTSNRIRMSSETITPEDAETWLGEGMVRLPKRIGAQTFSADHECTALVYEFERASSIAEPIQVTPGLPGRIHLTKSGLLGVLNR